MSGGASGSDVTYVLMKSLQPFLEVSLSSSWRNSQVSQLRGFHSIFCSQIAFSSSQTILNSRSLWISFSILFLKRKKLNISCANWTIHCLLLFVPHQRSLRSLHFMMNSICNLRGKFRQGLLRLRDINFQGAAIIIDLSFTFPQSRFWGPKTIISDERRDCNADCDFKSHKFLSRFRPQQIFIYFLLPLSLRNQTKPKSSQMHRMAAVERIS